MVATSCVAAGRAVPFSLFTARPGYPSNVQGDSEMLVRDTVWYMVLLIPCQLVTAPLSWPLTQLAGPDGVVVVGTVEVALVLAVE